MKIVTVIPLKKSVWRDNLSYFTAQDAPLGSLATVPVRGQQVLSLIIDSREVSDLKSELKTVDWQMRKVTKIKKVNYFDSKFMLAVGLTANYFATSPGPIIKATIPQAILDELPDVKNANSHPTEKILAEINATQEPEEERLARYKSLIRESFAKKQSVYLCLPTSADINRLIEPLKKGIENYVLVGHGALSKKEQIDFWKKALTTEHPILVVGTPLFLSLPREDISTIIIERENSPAYKMMVRPFVDWRYFIEELVKQREIRLVLGDSALRSETIYRLSKSEVSPLGSIKYRFTSNATNQIIPLVSDKDKTSLLEATNERLRERIENALDSNEKIFIYSGRRGLAPLTICRDCGTVMSCDVCHLPLTIHQNPRLKERVFICHKCGQIVEIEDECKNCKGQRLAIIGFGVEKIAEELASHFPQTTLFQIDSDNTKTSKKAEEIIKQFNKTPNSILIGTEMSLHYINGLVDNVIAVGLDAFLAMPDWRASEKLFSTLIRLKQLARKHFIIQTRQPEEKIFTYVTNGNLIDFYRDEITDRQEMGYPPFRVLIKISLAGSLPEIRKEMVRLEKMLEKWQPLSYPDISKNVKGLPVLNILLRLSASLWPEPEILKILRSLPPTFVINVDPESVL
jgi:primosomal protein N'